MPNFKGSHLLGGLSVGSSTGVFGVAYSIINWSGLFKGLGLSPGSWAKVVSKGFEDGHATTFMIDLKAKSFTMTGISDDTHGWVFYGGGLARDDWARPTTNAATDVYYTTGDDLPDKFRAVRGELEKTETTYAVLMPNSWFSTRYENCVSSSHYMVYKMGLGYWASSKGAWVPSFSNWLTWTATKFSSWKHHRFADCNTHIP